MTPPARDALEGLADSALAHHDLGAAERSLLTERENAVFAVTAADGGRYALRLHRPGYQSMETVRSELSWLDALREAGIDTPEAVGGRDGERVHVASHPGAASRPCVLFRWLDGAPLADGEVASFEKLGAINARLHEHALSWTPPAGFTRQRLDTGGLIGERAVWGHYGALPALDAAQRALLDRTAARIAARLDAYGQGADRFGLIHGDVMPDNVLVEGERPRVIDFDDCGFGWLMYDLATLLSSLGEKPHTEPARQAWVDGYRSVRPLGDEHLAIVDTLVLARGLMVLGWLHTRRDTEVARLFTDVLVRRTCEAAARYLEQSP